MSKRKKNTQQRFSERGVSLEQNCNRAEREVRRFFSSAQKALRAAAEPVISLPESVKILQESGRAEDVDKLMPMVRTIARDVDTFSGQVQKLDAEFKEVVKNRPTEKNALSDHYAKCHNIGMQLLEVNGNILNTVSKSAEDVIGLMKNAIVPTETEDKS